MQLETTSRLEREREFHDRRFAQEVRQPQGKYYAAIKDGAIRFNDRLKALARDADVLEYGCGIDPMLFSVAPAARSGTGIDISQVAIDEATQRTRTAKRGHLRFLTMDAEKMIFEAASFDLVFGRGIIHHLDIERCLAEIARVLRPGGIALFWEPLGHNLLLNVYRRLTPSARTPDEHPLLRPDFEVARRHFADVAIDFFGLTTLLSVPVRDTRLGDAMLGALAALDRGLFRVPGMKWQAWYCLMEMEAR
jgi:SAM-dependent methyltransferase